MFLTIFVLAVIAVAQAEDQESAKYGVKRGASGGATTSGLTAAQQQAYAIKLRQYQQAQAQAQAEAQSSAEVRYVPQSAKYTASPVAYNSGAAPVQYQPQQQAVAYALKQAGSPAYSTKAAYQVAQPVASPVQHYSLATDVSSFSYSSPIVRYSNLGLLSQISGKDSESTYQAQAPAPKATYYQAAPPAQAQPAQTRVQYVPQYETYQQAEQKSTQASQNYVVSPTKYVSAAPQQRYIYVSAQDVAQGQAAAAAPQQYVYQAVAQPQYEQQQYQAQPQYQAQQQYQAQPQYEKYEKYEKQAQASPTVAQVVYAQIPQQYQNQQQQYQSSAAKQGVAYE